MENAVLTILSVYVPQTRLEEATKDAFYDCQQIVISKLPDKEIVTPCCEWNRHIGREATGCEGAHGGYGCGEHNASKDRMPDFAVTNDFLCHWEFYHFVTYQSGNAKTQIHPFEEVQS